MKTLNKYINEVLVKQNIKSKEQTCTLEEFLLWFGGSKDMKSIDDLDNDDIEDIYENAFKGYTYNGKSIFKNVHDFYNFCQDNKNECFENIKITKANKGPGEDIQFTIKEYTFKINILGNIQEILK